jgi:energy-coupling factor transport system permease protein
LTVSYLQAFGYVGKRTILHEFHPIAKFVAILLAALDLTLLVQGDLFYFAILAAVLVISFYLRLGGYIRTYLYYSTLLSVMLFALDLGYSLYTTRLLAYSLYYSAGVVERLLIYVVLFSLFSLTTSPDELADSLLGVGMPYRYTLPITMAYRFVPTMGRELQSIQDSQKSRGLDFGSGGLLSRIKKYTPILVPLLANTLLRVDSVAEAMESKCFGATETPTRMTGVKFRIRDAALLGIVLLATALAVYYFVKTGSVIELA